EQCVLYSALDAHIRHLQVTVPEDAVAHIQADLAHAALRMMHLNMDAHICPADDISF
ncbi:isochorismatase family protein, partial [Streptomyces sp. NPDC006333]|uniref:isochorismatase family protein n=1 Tax=Streptomyces sp. NPDC006333 TaxID=3156753 RepID=UPI0033BF4257